MAKKLKKGHQASRKGKHRVPVPSKGGVPQHSNASNEMEARKSSQAKDCSCSHAGKSMDSNEDCREGSLNKMKSKNTNKKKGKGADEVTEITAAAHENVDGGGDGNHAARGLVNLGNTCFFNSVLQNLLSMEKMRNYFMNTGVPPVGPLTASLQKMFVEARDCVKQRNAMNPRPLFASLCAKASQFRGYEQHDSHELLLCFLDSLSMEELNGRKTTTAHENVDLHRDGTVVDALFGGRISSTVWCMECGHTSTVHEPFLDLSLPLPEKKKQKNPAPHRVSGKMKSPLKKGRRVRCAKSKENAVRVTEETGKSRDQSSSSSRRLSRVSSRTRSTSQLKKKQANGATEDPPPEKEEFSAIDSSEFDGFGGLFDEPGVTTEGKISDPESAEVDHTDSPVSLESCLAHFTKPELLLNKHARWRCENCSGSSSSSDENGASPDGESDFGRSRNAMKRILIDRLPQILTVHLKRFGQDGRGRLRKLNGHVVFKNSIDVGPYTTESIGLCREGGACATSVYRLMGVVEHMGTMSDGHYVSYTRGDARREREHDDDDDGDDSGFIWYYASDNHVRQASLREVLLSEAYILFYERQGDTSMEK